MTRHLTLQYQPVETMPEVLEQGVMYVSETYDTAIHLCACGCGEETVTPTSPPSGWAITIQDEKVSLYPSIGNYSFACQSHYYVTEGGVVWL